MINNLSNNRLNFPYVYVDIIFSRWDIVAKVCEQLNQFGTWSRDGSILFKTHELCFIYIHIEANASYCPI